MQPSPLRNRCLRTPQRAAFRSTRKPTLLVIPVSVSSAWFSNSRPGRYSGEPTPPLPLTE